MQAFIEHYGYLAIFVLMVAESACIPVPSEVTMVFGGALAGGAVPGVHLNLALVVVAGVVGNVVGSYVAWAIGYYGGQPAWRRWGRYVLLRDKDIDRAERWFGRHGAKAVFFSRLLPVIRTFISLPAGFARMHPLRFGIYTTAGCIPWTLGLAWAGYFVGASWQSVVAGFSGATYVLAAVLGAAIVIAVIALIWRYRRERAGSTGPGDGPGGSGAGEPGAGEPGAGAHRGGAREAGQGQGGQRQGGQRQGGQSWPR